PRHSRTVSWLSYALADATVAGLRVIEKCIRRRASIGREPHPGAFWVGRDASPIFKTAHYPWQKVLAHCFISVLELNRARVFPRERAIVSNPWDNLRV